MTKIITLSEAKEQGLSKYFTGKPCPKGHIAERYVAARKCTECNKEVTRRNYHRYYNPEKQHAYYLANKEKLDAQNAEWTKNNREKVKEIHKRWRKRNPEKLKTRDQEWRAKNPDRSRERLNEWRRQNLTKYRLQKYRRRMLEQTASGEFTDADIEQLLIEQNGLCVGCQCDITETFTIDHKIPLSRGGSNDRENIQLACKSCNSSKGTKTNDEWKPNIR